MSKKKPAKKKPAKKKRAPKKAVDDEMCRQAEQLATLGLSIQNVASVLGIAERTFHRYKADHPELEAAYKIGRARGIASVAKSLIDLIRGGNVAATIFFLKTQAGWRETSKVEHSGPEGRPVPVAQFDMSMEDWLKSVADVLDSDKPQNGETPTGERR